MKEYVPLRNLGKTSMSCYNKRQASKSFQVNLDLIKKEQLIDEDENTSKQLGGSIEPQVLS